MCCGFLRSDGIEKKKYLLEVDVSAFVRKGFVFRWSQTQISLVFSMGLMFRAHEKRKLACFSIWQSCQLCEAFKSGVWAGCGGSLIIPAEAEVGGSPEVRSSRPALPTW